MIIISSREFRQNQADYFDRIDNGEQIIVQRGKDKSYKLMPIGDNDVLLTEQSLKKLFTSLEEIKNGNSVVLNSENDIDQLIE